MDGEGASMQACYEVTKNYAAAYASTSTKDKGHRGSGGRGDRLEPRPHPPATVSQDGPAQEPRERHRQGHGHTPYQGLQVLLRRPHNPAHRVGDQWRVVRQVLGGIDERLARRDGGRRLPNAITIGTAGAQVESEPGFFEVDMVTHCGFTVKGEFCQTVNVTGIRRAS